MDQFCVLRNQTVKFGENLIIVSQARHQNKIQKNISWMFSSQQISDKNSESK